MYDITLSDGTELKNLILNGNNFISEQILPDAIFDGNLKPVIISDGENATIIEDAVLVSNRVEAQVTYTAMMTDTLMEGEVMFEKIKKWHKQGLWTDAMVRTAARKGLITEKQAQEILNGGI